MRVIVDAYKIKKLVKKHLVNLVKELFSWMVY